jgi:hypothetical protein
VSLTPQAAARNPRTTVPHLRLHAIDLVCSWKTQMLEEDKLHDDMQTDYQPFSRSCALSFVTAFDALLTRAVTWQLVRYTKTLSLLRRTFSDDLEGGILLFSATGAR